MIVVQAEVWPFGQPPEKADPVLLDRLIIVNDTTGTHDRGNYDLYRGDPRTIHEGWKHVGRVEDFPRGRQQQHGPALVRRALEVAE